MTRRELGRCRLAVILDEIGWSQQDLSNYSGISKDQVSRFISGERKISLRDAIAITDAVLVYVNKTVHPRELYEGTFKKPVRRGASESK
ncbi:helix-turn-helix domain-containing protein [Paenibacillus motobuensis]|uniref:helix-turn-helix domain-containing protein n=1 Tax=Paenibacillus motobuensis TaxID=295324 RepID=UPI003635D1C4